MGREIERVPAKPLDHLGLIGPSDVPCVAIRWQIAQKLHACTEIPPEGRINDRFRDLIDVLLLWGLVAEDEQPTVREACEEIFALRATHPWPPRVTVFGSWLEPYRALAEEVHFAMTDVADAAQAVQGTIDAIAQADQGCERTGRRPATGGLRMP